MKSKYYFLALDNFNYDMSLCIENLEYALSYDSDDADTHCLLGRVYSEMLKDYNKAIECFEEALQIDVLNINIYGHYINCLILNEDYKVAEKAILFAKTIKGIDKANIFYLEAFLQERLGNYKKAVALLEEAKKHSFYKNVSDYVEEKRILVKAKLPEKKSKKTKVVQS
ncbi:MAG: hypothetical protein DI598_17695 [Pseudopedobacter saltans]|uniref:Uncharacterized protein n=1 Tax=Pseudopedobacter saltans TaxID=151895 RepID=A0A2W5ECZ7_9SPHI|nr:MAG: hypothetical protein DI598_17695 [Pseudopedobacter saltans]